MDLPPVTACTNRRREPKPQTAQPRALRVGVSRYAYNNFYSFKFKIVVISSRSILSLRPRAGSSIDDDRDAMHENQKSYECLCF